MFLLCLSLWNNWRKAAGSKWSIGSSIWTWGRTSLVWGWQSTGTGCPEGLWSLLRWRYSKPTWTRSCATCSTCPCFGRGGGLDDPQRSLPTPTILWFCNSGFLLECMRSKNILSQEAEVMKNNQINWCFISNLKLQLRKASSKRIIMPRKAWRQTSRVFVVARASLRLCIGVQGRGSWWVSACISERLWKPILCFLVACSILIASSETAFSRTALQRTGKENPVLVSTGKGTAGTSPVFWKKTSLGSPRQIVQVDFVIKTRGCWW